MFRHNNEKSSVTTPATAEVRKTALNSIHRQLGAKMVNFGGWDMPLEYSGILAEHEAVRTRAGLFDVSHMGEIEIRGPGALGPVSYTHLDVYKRQDLAWGAIMSADGSTGQILGVALGAFDPVSYTHLDVYKRQRYR